MKQTAEPSLLSELMNSAVTADHLRIFIDSNSDSFDAINDLMVIDERLRSKNEEISSNMKTLSAILNEQMIFHRITNTTWSSTRTSLIQEFSRVNINPVYLWEFIDASVDSYEMANELLGDKLLQAKNNMISAEMRLLSMLLKNSQ